MIRVGILGAGTLASFQMPGISRIPDFEVAGFWDPEPERASKYAARWGGRAYAAEAELLGDSSLDAVLVFSPTPCHRDQVLAALAAGRHVFCEKPIAGTLADAAAMIQAGERSGKVFMVGQVLRFFHEYEDAHRIVASGELGRVCMVRSTRAAGFPRGWRDWYADRSQSGGVLHDMVVHDFDWLRWTLGPVERVFARAVAPPGELFDYGLVVLRFAAGAMAHVEASWAHPPGTFFTRLEVAGTDGMLAFDSRSAAPIRVTRRAAEGQAAGVAVPESPVAHSPYRREMQHFADLVAGRTKPVVEPRDALEAIRIALAARRSAESGRVVAMGEVKP